MKSYYAIVKNQGGNIFPLDMLRYASCYPAHQSDVENMPSTYAEANYKGEKEVKLFSQANRGQWYDERWDSFGWKVVEKGIVK